MADLTIRLVSNPKTGKRDIYIDYESEDDALPYEHEQDHHHIVEQLLGAGVLSGDDVGQVRVGRVEPSDQHSVQIEEGPERDAQGQGS